MKCKFFYNFLFISFFYWFHCALKEQQSPEPRTRHGFVDTGVQTRKQRIQSRSEGGLGTTNESIDRIYSTGLGREQMVSTQLKDFPKTLLFHSQICMSSTQKVSHCEKHEQLWAQHSMVIFASDLSNSWDPLKLCYLIHKYAWFRPYLRN